MTPTPPGTSAADGPAPAGALDPGRGGVLADRLAHARGQLVSVRLP